MQGNEEHIEKKLKKMSNGKNVGVWVSTKDILFVYNSWLCSQSSSTDNCNKSGKMIYEYR